MYCQNQKVFSLCWHMLLEQCRQLFINCCVLELAANFFDIEVVIPKENDGTCSEFIKLLKHINQLYCEYLQNRE
jgi:hypothetical protein